MARNESSAADTADRLDPQDLTVTLEWQDRAAVLAVAGEVDMVTAPRFQKEMSAALEQQPDKLVVDLTKVGFFDSAGLSALVAAYQEAGRHSSVRVVASNGATVRPLRLTALDRKILVYDTVDDALSGQ